MTWRAAAEVNEVAPERPVSVEVEDVKLAIVLHGGRYFAIEDECSHGSVPLSEGDVADGAIECYLHGSAFDLVSGAPRCLPATQSVRVFPCRLDGEQIVVDLNSEGVPTA